MQSTEVKESNLVNQWTTLNRILFIYKAAGATLAVLCLFLGILAIVLANRSPIVAVATENDYLFFQSRRSKLDLNEANIKRFIERYVKLYYEWEVLEPEKIAQNIGPLVTDGFRAKAYELLKLRRDKEFVGKTLRQNVSGISIQVTKEDTIAVFDVVMRVEGIPLIVPTQLAFQLVKGNQTEWNPLGLYINGATMHEGK